MLVGMAAKALIHKPDKFLLLDGARLVLVDVVQELLDLSHVPVFPDPLERRDHLVRRDPAVPVLVKERPHAVGKVFGIDVLLARVVGHDHRGKLLKVDVARAIRIHHVEEPVHLVLVLMLSHSKQQTAELLAVDVPRMVRIERRKQILQPVEHLARLGVMHESVEARLDIAVLGALACVRGGIRPFLPPPRAHQHFSLIKEELEGRQNVEGLLLLFVLLMLHHLNEEDFAFHSLDRSHHIERLDHLGHCRDDE
mmetsp:Transcript_10059/g.24618  ORF Transcript_10059/g.24618 Transcript_10059/m.24618 type:complete len:253 (+) Transcript_10059:34-792(+)